MSTNTRRAGALALATVAAVSLMGATGIVTANAAPAGSHLPSAAPFGNSGGGTGSTGVPDHVSPPSHSNAGGNGAPHQPGDPGDTVTFTTQNGTASITVPGSWSIADRSYLGESGEGEPAWINVLDITGDGVELIFVDTPHHGGGFGYAPDAWEAVVEHGLGDGLTAMALWSHDLESGLYTPHVALTYVQHSDEHGFGGYVFSPVVLSGSDSIYTFEADLADASGDVPTFVSETEVAAFLISEQATAALGAIAGLELSGVDWRTLPDGVEPEPEPPLEAFTTQNGTASFAFDGNWAAQDASGFFIGGDGAEHWMNDVFFRSLDTGGHIIYMDGMEWGDGGGGEGVYEVFDRSEIAGGYDVVSLASVDEWGVYPGVYVVERGASEPSFAVPSPVEGRVFAAFAGVGGIDGCEVLVTLADAESCLASPGVEQLRVALASMVQHAVPVGAQP